MPVNPMIGASGGNTGFFDSSSIGLRQDLGNYSPETQNTITSEERKRRIANMLLQRGMQPRQGQMTGRFFTPPSKWEQGSDLAQAALGVYMNYKANENEETAIKDERDRANKLNEKITNVIMGMSPAQEATLAQPSQEQFISGGGVDDFEPTMTQPIAGTPAVPAKLQPPTQRLQGLNQLMADPSSDIPSVQRRIEQERKTLTDAITRESDRAAANVHSVDLGDKVAIYQNGQLLRYEPKGSAPQQEHGISSVDLGDRVKMYMNGKFTGDEMKGAPPTNKNTSHIQEINDGGTIKKFNIVTGPDGKVISTEKLGDTGKFADVPKGTVGEQTLDKKFAADYEIFSAGGGFSGVQKNLDSLAPVLQKLAKQDNLTGPFLNLVPDAMMPFISQDARAALNDVQSVVQQTLRQILGGQFAQKEGEQLIRRAYDPAAEEGTNLERTKRLFDQILVAAKAKQSAMEYWESHGGTLRGWKGSEWKITDFDVEDDEAGPGVISKVKIREMIERKEAEARKGKP